MNKKTGDTALAGQLRQQLRQHLRPLRLPAATDDTLIAWLAQSRLALLGAASHGSHEFHAERAALTRRLVAEHGFTALAVEADWPDALRVHRYIRGRSDDPDAASALAGFDRFAHWPWRNPVLCELVEWLREHNRKLPPARQVGFYGLDWYGLAAAIRTVLEGLERADPQAAQRARWRFACLDHFGEDGPGGAPAAGFGLRPDCEDEAVQQLVEMNRRAAAAVPADADPEDAFFAHQSAALARNAEEYHRTLFQGRVAAWNLRASHMAQNLQALQQHLAARQGGTPRIVVWGHNALLGDACATEQADLGAWNLGQLCRDHWGRDAVLMGFTCHHGSITSAAGWDAPARAMPLAPALPGSWEDLFHQCELPRLWLPLRGHAALASLLAAPRLQRGIGVVYRPESERASHWFEARVPAQFDALVHVDVTRALDPLA